MATQQSKIRAGSGSRKNQRVQAAEPTIPLGDRLRSVTSGISRLMPGLNISDGLRRELISVFSFLLGLLSLWVLASSDTDGSLVDWWGRALHSVWGTAAYIVPAIFFAISFRAFKSDDEPIVLPRHYLGAAGFTMAVVGLFELASSHANNGDGGWLGSLSGTALRDVLGETGAGVTLLVIGCASVFLLAGTGVRSLYRDIQTIWPERIVEEPAPDPKPEPVPLPKPKPVKPVKTDTASFERVAPVINVPKAEPKPSAKDLAPVKVSPVAAGEPMPLPDIARLAYYETASLDTADLESKARLIEQTLGSFKVEARVREINPGPAVTQFTLEPGVGIKVARITQLQNDLALALAAPSIRIEAPVPGMARVGVEIPNAQVATVGLRETLESPGFARSKAKLPIPLGRDVNGKYVVHDLAKMPHLLIAGATGSGKSVGLNAIISTFLLTRGPDELKLVMVDPKMVELVGYNGVPHLQCPVITEMDKVVGALRLCVQEMQRRYDLFAKHQVRNIDGYRLKVADEQNAEKIPYLVVVLDELADLMMTSPEEVETLLCRLTQMGRAAGIHLIIATQRPSVDVLTGLIKANVPARIAFAVTSFTNSQVILDMPGAERLLGRGDMLFMPPDAAKPLRIQGAFVEDKDVHYIVGHWHAVAPVPKYAEEWMSLPSSNSSESGGDEDDEMMEKALEVARELGTISASMLQRKLRIGYNRAARLMERMDDEGLVGPSDGAKGRAFLGGDY
jgi:S-DNA-T family DNA segregation ATPase FtsK/SpoIIIE